MKRRIAGIHQQDDGAIGAVWLENDTIDGSIRVIDCCIFRNEVPIVIAEGLNVRGRWIPIAWNKKDKVLSDNLLDRGCRMLYDAVDDSKTAIDLQNREFLELLRVRRIKTNKRMADWNDEYKGFKDSDGSGDAYPLMSATRNAITMLKSAISEKTKVSKPVYPAVSMI